MASKVSLSYLERRKIFLALAGRGLFATNSLLSHQRPVKALPALLPPDSPAARVITQKDEDRVAYNTDGPLPEME